MVASLKLINLFNPKKYSINPFTFLAAVIKSAYNKVKVTFGAIPSIGTIISYHGFITTSNGFPVDPSMITSVLKLTFISIVCCIYTKMSALSQ
jgi:hypothetical protein